MILQVERDDRCAALLRKRFPQASLTREVSDVKELPAETEILASSLNWPEQADDQLNDQVVGEHLRLPASCAATVTEHSHIFRLLAVRPVSWVLLELPVTLLRWVTASTPGREKIFTFATLSVPRLINLPKSGSDYFFPKTASKVQICVLLMLCPFLWRDRRLSQFL